MLKALVWILVIGLAAAGATYYFVWSPPDPADAALPVQVKTIWQSAHGTGLIEGNGALTRLKFPFAGILDEVEPKENSSVKLNDILATLNSTEIDDRIALEKIALKEAKAKRDAIAARKNVDEIEKKEAEFKRARLETREAELKLTKLKTPDTARDRQDRQEDAKLAVEHAQRSVAVAEAELKQLLAHPSPHELEAAEARLNLAKSRTGSDPATAAELRYALADYEKVKRGPSAEEKEVANARVAQAKTELDRAEAEKRRAERPLAPVPLPQAEIEFAEKALAEAQAVEAKKRAELELIRKDLDTAESGVANAAVEKIEQNIKSFEKMKLGYQLRAPFDGLIVKRHVEPGALLAPYEDVLWIVDFTRKRVRAEFDIVKLQSLIKPGLNASVKSRAFGKGELSARVIEIGKVGTRKLLQDDPSQPRGGEVVEVLLEIDPPKDEALKPLFALLRPGLRVEADVVLESRANVLCIPNSYLGTDRGETGSDKKYVMKADPNSKKHRFESARKQEVKCGIRDEYYVEILEGLNADDLVVKPKAQNK